MDPRYDILFAGQLLSGYEPAAVRARLGGLFKADEATLDKLFSGKPQVLKRHCDKRTALQYKEALERAGAQPIIRHSNTPDATAARAAEGHSGGQLELEPAGSDVLRPEERAGSVAATIAVPALELAAAGARLTEATVISASPPDVSHLSLDPPGAYPTTRNSEAPIASGDDIELAAPGTDFSDCAPPPAQAPEPDLSGLELAPAGADVLEPRYRAQKVPQAPDTSGLSLLK